jgi:hypothetical protein
VVWDSIVGGAEIMLKITVYHSDSILGSRVKRLVMSNNRRKRRQRALKQRAIAAHSATLAMDSFPKDQLSTDELLVLVMSAIDLMLVMHCVVSLFNVLWG